MLNKEAALFLNCNVEPVSPSRSNICYTALLFKLLADGQLNFTLLLIQEDAKTKDTAEQNPAAVKERTEKQKTVCEHIK